MADMPQKGQPEPARTERGIVLTAEEKRRQRRRNIAIAVTLAALCVLFWVVTMIKGAAVFRRPL